jgi:hypothetical protein
LAHAKTQISPKGFHEMGVLYKTVQKNLWGQCPKFKSDHTHQKIQKSQYFENTLKIPKKRKQVSRKPQGTH